VKLSESSFLADENIHPAMILFLKNNGYDISTVGQLNLTGKSDHIIINEALKTDRIIITHDSDFGSIAVAGGETFTGIIYLRPGHIKGDYAIETIKTVLQQDIEVSLGMIIVAQRQNETVKIRIRRQ
jgi:predicted nuclease of predicted toxin-antitoxin system